MATAANDFLYNDNKYYKEKYRYREIENDHMKRSWYHQIPHIPAQGASAPIAGPTTTTYRGMFRLSGLSKYREITMQCYNSMYRFFGVEIDATPASLNIATGGHANQLTHGQLCFIKKNSHTAGGAGSGSIYNLMYCKYMMHLESDANTTILIFERNMGRWPYAEFSNDWSGHLQHLIDSAATLWKAHADDITAGNAQASATSIGAVLSVNNGIRLADKSGNSLLSSGSSTAKYTVAQERCYMRSNHNDGRGHMIMAESGYPSSYWTDDPQSFAAADQAQATPYDTSSRKFPAENESGGEFWDGLAMPREYNGTGRNRTEWWPNYDPAHDSHNSHHPGKPWFPFTRQAYTPVAYGESVSAGSWQYPDDTMWFSFYHWSQSANMGYAQSGWPLPHANWSYSTDADTANIGWSTNPAAAGSGGNTQNDGANDVTNIKLLSADIYMDFYKHHTTTQHWEPQRFGESTDHSTLTIN